MGLEKFEGDAGRLSPTLAQPGLDYQVDLEIHFPILEREPVRRLTPNHMYSSKCLLRLFPSSPDSRWTLFPAYQCRSSPSSKVN